MFVSGSSNESGVILLIEDEEALRMPVAKILRRRGFVVIEASDGGSAVDLYRTTAGRIDMVVLDMTLPGMPGADVFEQLEEIRPGAKIVVTSAYGKETVLDALGGRRPWAYIQKPYSPNGLADLLLTACMQRGSAAGAAPF